MTSEVQSLLPRTGGVGSAASCEHCLRRLGREYYFTCLKCKASYCYIHMSRHQPAPCSRREARLKRALQQRSERVTIVSAGRRTANHSSANV